MRKHTKYLLTRALALFMALVMCSTSALAATTVRSELVCDKTAHTHSDDCYTVETVETKELTCSDESHHVHSDECYVANWELTCKQAEEKPHEHSDELSCYESIEVLTCGETEHAHSEDCYADGQTCGLSEHTHGDACVETRQELTCTENDVSEHHHVEGCYERTDVLVCGQEEIPHTEACYTVTTEERKVLTCTTEEHVHIVGCYSADNVAKDLSDALKAAATGEDKEVILILNGATLTYSGSGNKIQLTNGQTLTIKDGDDVAGGTIQGDGSSPLRLILVMNGSTLNLTGETVLTGGTAEGGAAIYASGEGTTVNIEGGTITGNKTGGTNKAGGAILAENQAEVNMTGGEITNNWAVFGGGVALNGGAAFNMSGGTISDNEGRDRAGGVYVKENSIFNMTDGTITGNSAQNGGAVMLIDSTFNMTGGTISDSTASLAGGGIFVERSAFDMSGGTITGNTANTETMNGSANSRREKNEYYGQGGGVYVQDGSFDLSGDAVISSNTAAEGGGIFINGYNAEVASKGGPKENAGFNFAMTGGVVDGNVANLGEGGGIYIQGEGEISGGRITNNATYTSKDLGGGGIYIESKGTLKLTNAVIIANTANGLGGGIAACVNGKSVVYAADGAAIFGNNALGKGRAEGYQEKHQDGAFVDGYALWEPSELFKSLARDVFAASDASTAANSQGTAGIVVGNTMLGGGSADWTGYTYCYAVNPDGSLARADDGSYILELNEVTSTNNGVVLGNRMVFLTAEPDQAAIDAAVQAMSDLAEGRGVLIAGNLSANTHGGGIANNGVLTIGTDGEEEPGFTDTNSHRPEVSVSKTLTNTADNSGKGLTAGQFTFELVDGSGKQVGTVTNKADGSTPQFNFPAELFGAAGTYTFYVREIEGQKVLNGGTIGYDRTEYRLTITVTEETKTIIIGKKGLTVTTLTVNEPVIEICGGDGEWTQVDGVRFHNLYTPGEPDPENPQPEKGRLTVSKTVTGAGEEDWSFDFSVTIGGESQTITLTKAIPTWTSPEEYEVGTYYEVSEVPDDGYTCSQVGNSKGTIGEGNMNPTVSFTNTKDDGSEKDPEKGSLTISKSLGAGAPAAAAGKTYAFTVTGPDGSSQDVTVTGAGITTLDNLAPGMYTVTEDRAGAEIEGYTLSVSGGGTVEVKQNETAEITVTNTYTETEKDPEKGKLTVSKTVTGAGNEDWSFTFSVTIGGSAQTVTLTKANPSRTFENLAIGTAYSVSEVPKAGYTLTGSANVSGTIGDGNMNPTASFTNEKDDGGNKQDPEKGSLTITKSLGADAPAAAAGKTYSFTVTGPNGYRTAVTITGAGSATLEDLAPGTYTVTEDSAGAAIAGYTLSVSGGGAAEVTAGGTAGIAVTNTYTPGNPPKDPPDDPKDPPDDPKDPPEDPKDPPEDPKDPPDDPKDPPEDPKDPPEDPNNPPEDPNNPPENPGYPTELPDPNDPDSPEEITIWEDGVPMTYIKVWDPEEEEWIYIPVPLANVPRTEDSSHVWAVLTVASGTGLVWLALEDSEDRKKRTSGK